ncbi:oxysterol-binding protein-related protein 4C isoform X2 [Spinacia oleracea]|uniref:Oxysterol-binding protein-related protein 4C isoform X2 n=1 Tax=Spinacia oleracea TaxID=3562 RepID=A0A9R0INH8_SPIOL|nr:oxysterol-binding protein-related protein 4C-like isoform X2 [Spinacia oleracea]
MVQELKNEKKRDVILTNPVSLDGDSNNDYKPPNVLQMVFSLLNNVRPGADLTRFQLPPLFNLPKSHLQCYGESVYCVNKDMLSKCANGETADDRMIAVVAWSISTVRPLMFGVAPYNPILGETHHASRGTLNVLLEQVSHHPPVSALHATDETNGIELIWCQHAVPKFQGTTVETVVHGKRKLNLVQKGESYVMNSPKLLIRLLPKLGVDWVGNVRIKCQETGLEAELSFKTASFMGFGGGNRSIKGKIMHSSKTLYEIHGQWDRIVKIKDVIDGKTKVLYNAKDVISKLPSSTLRDPKGVWQSESAAVWAEVSKGIISKEWDKAREAKRAVEEKERELHKQRKSIGEIWVPKHFDLCYTLEDGWDCIPKQNTIPPAPISFPI